jgi:hypothetical protein
VSSFDRRDSQALHLSPELCQARRTPSGIELIFGAVQQAASLPGASTARPILTVVLSEAAARQLLALLAEQCAPAS